MYALLQLNIKFCDFRWGSLVQADEKLVVDMSSTGLPTDNYDRWSLSNFHVAGLVRGCTSACIQSRQIYLDRTNHKHLKILFRIWLVRPSVQSSSYKISFVLNQNCINNLMKTFSFHKKVKVQRLFFILCFPYLFIWTWWIEKI